MVAYALRGQLIQPVLDGAYTFTQDRARFHRALDAELVRLLETDLVGQYLADE